VKNSGTDEMTVPETAVGGTGYVDSSTGATRQKHPLRNADRCMGAPERKHPHWCMFQPSSFVPRTLFISNEEF
jgi:hypothetical protein